MDVLVRLNDDRTDSPLLARVDSIPGRPQESRGRREVVTLYGVPDAFALALALAATMEGERIEQAQLESEQLPLPHLEVVRRMGVWPNEGAMGDAAWRDAAGRLVTRDLRIPMAVLELRAAQLLGDHGTAFRRAATAISVPAWPEGADRSVGFTLLARHATSGLTNARTPAHVDAEQWLDAVREADAHAFAMQND